MPGLKELILTHNKFGPQFLKSVLSSITNDTYLRVLDLRKNKFTKQVLQDKANYDVIKAFQGNESLTNIDFRFNDGFDQNMMF